MAKKLHATWACIAWAPYSRRSEMFARALGGNLHCIHYLHFQTPVYAPIKYVLQGIRTLYLLFRERPKAVHVQNPPFVCGLVVYIYCHLSGAYFVFDHHSAAFAHQWRWALPLQKRLACRAVTNIVTNRHWAKVVQGWGAHTLVMSDPFLPLPEGEPYSIKSGFNVAFVSTFAPDEPLDAVLDAAAQLPEVHFYITGDVKRKPESFFDNLPDNVVCTGFLPDAQYIGLLRAIDAIMALTTRDYTLQLGGCEAVSLGKPLITSNWPYLQEVFAKGAIYVDNSAKGIREGILAMQQNHESLEKEIVAFRQESRREWNSQFVKLEQIIENGCFPKEAG
jgi:glycosyltransferase involved in cell wall biosynthesis